MRGSSGIGNSPGPPLLCWISFKVQQELCHLAMSTACGDVQRSPFNEAHKATASEARQAKPLARLLSQIDGQNWSLQRPNAIRQRGSHWCTSSKWRATLIRLKWHAMHKVECSSRSVTLPLSANLQSLTNSLSVIITSAVGEHQTGKPAHGSQKAP